MTLPGLLDRRCFAWALVVLWAVVYLPHLSTRTMRLEEGRRSTVAREMLASGDFVRPTLYGSTYLYKPPLFNWTIAVVGTFLGEVCPLAARIPSVLASLGCAFVALGFARETLDRRTRSLAALFVLASSTLLDKGTLGEIDAVLCLMVSLALAFWWDGNRADRQTMGSWLIAGALLGLSGLQKGPSGPSIFYLTILPYMLWTGRWRRLFTVGHLLCLVLMALPSLAWTMALLDRGVIPAKDLIKVWSGQLGVGNAAAVVTDPVTRLNHLAVHYVEFPLLVLGMFFPGVLWLGYGLRRRWAEAHGMPEDLRKFLVCGVLGPCLAYFVYPESRPRHLMPAFFPAAVLAAMVVSAMARQPGPWGLRGRRLALILAWAPVVVGVLGVVFAAVMYPPAIPAGLVAVAAGAGWTWLSLRLTRATPVDAGPLALAVAIINVSLSTWFVFNMVVVPWQAPKMITHQARELSVRIPPDELVYTTRTFPTRSEGLYNLQFHIARNVRAIPSLDALKEAAPCTAIVLEPERLQLEASGYVVEEIGRTPPNKDWPPELHVIRLKKPAE